MKTTDTGFSIGKVLFGIIAITFVAEFLVMAMLAQFGYAHASLQAFFANAVILTIVITPPIYLLILYPAKRAYESWQQGMTTTVTPPHAEEGDKFDPLTHVLSRQAVTVDLLEAIAHADRYGNRLSVAMLEVDRLPQIRKEHGEQAGEAVVQSVAMSLTDTLRMPDRVGRYADSNFLLVLPETDIKDATKLADRIRESIAGMPVQYQDKAFPATVSVGLTQFRKGEDLELLLGRASAAMRQAQTQGSDRVVAQMS